MFYDEVGKGPPLTRDVAGKRYCRLERTSIRVAVANIYRQKCVAETHPRIYVVDCVDSLTCLSHSPCRDVQIEIAKIDYGGVILENRLQIDFSWVDVTYFNIFFGNIFSF